MPIYTKSELTKKTCKVSDAIDYAKKRVPGKPICVDVIRRKGEDTMVTLAEFNEIIDQIVDDTVSIF